MRTAHTHIGPHSYRPTLISATLISAHTHIGPHSYRPTLISAHTHTDPHSHRPTLISAHTHNGPHSYRPTLTTEVSEAVPPHHLICYKKELALRDPASLSANQVLPTALLCTSLHQTASCSKTHQFSSVPYLSETHQFSSVPYLSSFLKPQTFYKSQGSHDSVHSDFHPWVMIQFNLELWCEFVEGIVSITRDKLHTEYSHVQWWYIQIKPFLSMHLWAGIAQSVLRLAMGWTVHGSKPSEGWDFLHPSRPAPGPTQPPIQWVPGLCQG
jgi:hypothetical protein